MEPRRQAPPPPRLNRLDPEPMEASPLLDDELAQTGDGAEGSGWSGLYDFDGLHWWRTPSVFWLLAPFTLLTLAFGGVIVPKLNLILHLICRRYFADEALVPLQHPLVLGGDDAQCRIPEVQKNVATFMLVISFVTGGLSAFVAPKFGHMSDRYGRCRLLALVSCGGLLAELITILTAKFPQTVDYRWLFLGAVFDGMTGSFTAGNILSQSYTSDCTPPSKRAVSIGYVQACLFVGLALGPLLAGYFVKWTGSLVSIFYVSLVCHAFFALFVGFLIPESLSAKKQLAARDKWQKEKEARAMHMGSWLSAVLNWNPLAPLKILWPTGPGTSTRLRVNLMALAISDAILLGAALAVGPVLMLYAEFMFQWGNLEASRFVSFLSMARVVVLMCIFPLINHFGRVRPAARRRKLLGAATVESNSGADRLDLWVLRFALFWDVLGTLGYALSWNEALFVGSGFITALGGPGSATAQAVATQHVPPERVGQILGAIGMLHALSRVVGPIVFNGIYAATVATYPKAVILALCGLFVIALVCSFIVRPHVYWEDFSAEAEEPPHAAQQAIDADAEPLLVDED